MMHLVYVRIFTIFVIATLARAAQENPASPKCKCVCGVRGRFNRIVGGKEPRPHDHPWTTALLKNQILYCGATVISNNYLLTAAHCIYNFLPEEIMAYLGGHRIYEDRSEIKSVSTILYHDKFDAVTFNNDIGLVKLENPIAFGSKIQPACLPTTSAAGATDYSGELGVVMGWGRTGEKEDTSAILNYVSIPIWSQTKCAESGYGSKRLTGNMMCAGYEEGLFDACQGDSGGPMVRELASGSAEIIGIISWGRGCARPTYPGIYTIVGNYLPWIKKYLSSECLCSIKKKNVLANF